MAEERKSAPRGNRSNACDVERMDANTEAEQAREDFKVGITLEKIEGSFCYQNVETEQNVFENAPYH